MRLYSCRAARRRLCPVWLAEIPEDADPRHYAVAFA